MKSTDLGSADDMIVLAEIAEAGSFTAAGARMGMPKSTISQRIAQLEKRLGLRLLNRSTRQVSLTGSGQIYLEHCRRVRAEVAAARMAMSNLREQPVGTLRITCPEVTASYFMPSFLRGFTERFPRIAIELIATNRHLDIVRESIDFAFRVGQVSGGDLLIRRISAIKRVLVASPAYLEAAEPVAAPQDLARHRCLLHDAQPEWVFSNGDTRTALRPTAAAASDSMGFLLQSALADGGITLLPAYVCQPSIAAGRLIAVLPTWAIPPYEMYLVSPSRKHQSSAQAAFRSFTRTYSFSQFSSGSDPGRPTRY
jgi:DNA-binding transcriptional LysR family regulator